MAAVVARIYVGRDVTLWTNHTVPAQTMLQVSDDGLPTMIVGITLGLEIFSSSPASSEKSRHRNRHEPSSRCREGDFVKRYCEGRVAVITGAGRGLEREYALQLAQHGAKIVVNDLGGGTDGGGS